MGAVAVDANDSQQRDLRVAPTHTLHDVRKVVVDVAKQAAGMPLTTTGSLLCGTGPASSLTLSRKRDFRTFTDSLASVVAAFGRVWVPPSTPPSLEGSCLRRSGDRVPEATVAY